MTTGARSRLRLEICTASTPPGAPSWGAGATSPGASAGVVAGAAAVRASAVAAEAGFTKGAVYSNFDSKEDLFFDGRVPR